MKKYLNISNLKQQKISNEVITFPTYFNESQIQTTKDAITIT